MSYGNLSIASSLPNRLIILGISNGQANWNWPTILRMQLSTSNQHSTESSGNHFSKLYNVRLQFTPNLASISTPLNDKLRMGEQRKLNSLRQEEQESLATLQDNPVSSPRLTIPCSKRYLTLHSDGISKQITCALMQ